MRYNPLAYIRSEKDILKLVNALIMNTKGEGEKSSEDFWVQCDSFAGGKKSAHGQRFSVVRRTDSLIGGMTG